MTKERKEDMQIYTAIALVIAGLVMCFWGFFTPPAGEVHETVLWFLGQTLAFAAAVFGLTSYVRGRVERIEKKVFNEDVKNGGS